MKHPYLDGLEKPQIFAHRGFVQQAHDGTEHIVENSLASFAAAHALGITYIESDCHLTRDGQVVLFHDETLTRLFGDPRHIADVDLSELEQLMQGKGGLVTLQNALDSFPDMRFNIDVKADSAAELAGHVVATQADRVLLTSFSDRRRKRALQAARSLGAAPATSPGQGEMIKILLASALGISPWLRKLFSSLDALQIPERSGILPILTRRLLRQAHAANVEVHVWTVNDEKTMRRLVKMGVDGIVTDRSDMALTVKATLA